MNKLFFNEALEDFYLTEDLYNMLEKHQIEALTDHWIKVLPQHWRLVFSQYELVKNKKKTVKFTI